jgi:hypothetical protein
VHGKSLPQPLRIVGSRNGQVNARST